MNLNERTVEIQASQLPWAPVICQYCSRPAVLKYGRDIQRTGSATELLYWRCDACAAHVRCYAEGAQTRYGISCGCIPMGALADSALRQARQQAHAAFDPFWQTGALTRKEALTLFGQRMGIAFEHIGELLTEECQLVSLVAPLLWPAASRHLSNQAKHRRRNPKYRIR